MERSRKVVAKSGDGGVRGIRQGRKASGSGDLGGNSSNSGNAAEGPFPQGGRRGCVEHRALLF